MSGLDDLAGIGADRRRGGYSRHVFDDAERTLREWFVEQAERRGLAVETDANTNIWAWWGRPGPGAVVTGSHLDSVPGGGAFDGPLGVVSALEAVDLLRERGFQPRAPLALIVFAEEEGGRFGIPCLGSRLMTGTIHPDRARGLRDADGLTFAEAMGTFGADPARIGRDDGALGRIGTFVELHVEQGKGLIDLDRPVAVADSILGHGRWRFRFRGQGNHAGATLIDDRHDPMIPAARLVLAARSAAEATRDGRATVGRLVPTPGGTNVIASSVDVHLDARAPRGARSLVDDLTEQAREFAWQEGCRVDVVEESFGDTVHFDPTLRDRLRGVLDDAPILPTGAGHDAGVLAAETPTAMLFVRNPTGISHAPEEHATAEDCEEGSHALARVLAELAG
ncbi:allantoate amidohydrolase [Saccharopolyspora sp. ID03-671]|uniref:allantoate amidohydrolase n=1 Tax=Saccharopolyspora sp. ID03-671 TaxID=3073066 RepID=UPI00324F4EBF